MQQASPSLPGHIMPQQTSTVRPKGPTPVELATPAWVSWFDTDGLHGTLDNVARPSVKPQISL